MGKFTILPNKNSKFTISETILPLSDKKIDAINKSMIKSLKSPPKLPEFYSRLVIIHPRIASIRGLSKNIIERDKFYYKKRREETIKVAIEDIKVKNTIHENKEEKVETLLTPISTDTEYNENRNIDDILYYKNEENYLKDFKEEKYEDLVNDWILPDECQ